jgi:Regulator of chromosome condensation (RCC1) repeat
VENLDSVATCWHATVFYKIGSNKVIIWGENKFGITCESGKVELPGPIQWLGCQSESVVAVAEDTDCNRSLYAWGWNEHGNLGLNDRENRKSAQKVVEIQTTTTVICGGAFLYLIN